MYLVTKERVGGRGADPTGETGGPRPGAWAHLMLKIIQCGVILGGEPLLLVRRRRGKKGITLVWVKNPGSGFKCSAASATSGLFETPKITSFVKNWL